MAERRPWPTLVIRSRRPPEAWPDPIADLVAGVLDDYAPVAIEDLAPIPLPPDGMWDPTVPPPPDPLPSPLALRVFFDSPVGRDAALLAVTTTFPDLQAVAEEVADDDWAARSQRALSAVAAGAFVVAPPWDRPAAPPAGTTVVVIEPSRGFGTGHHASTRLCLRALSETPVRDARVLDLGTGSGVLAIAAAARGARTVAAVDIDPDAVESARASAARNPGAAAIDWLVGDFRDAGWAPLAQEPWDVVLANLTGGMLTASAPRVRGLVRAGGRLIAGGFDATECPAVEQALGLAVAATYLEDGWVGLVFISRGAADSSPGADSTPRSADASP